MKLRFVTILPFLGTLAMAGVPSVPVLFWSQIAAVPPGTTGTTRTDVIPGTPTTAGTVSVVPIAPGISVPVSGGVVNSAQPGRPPDPGARGGPLGVGLPGPGLPAPGHGTGTASGTNASPVQPGGSAPSSVPLPGAANQAAQPVCTVTLAASRANIGAAGGTLDAAAQTTPAGCRPVVKFSADWLREAPKSTAGMLEFTAVPNPTPAPRLAAVIVGDQSFTVEQEPRIAASFAAAPGRLIFGIRRKKEPQPKTFSIVSDDKNLTYTVSSDQPWLKVSAGKSGKGGRQFVVEVDPSKLARGHNEGYVRVAAAGVAGRALLIPVLAEVPAVR